MNTVEWIDRARSQADILRDFIAHYHPNAGNGRSYKGQPSLPITAPNVERIRSGYDAHTGKQHDESRSIVAQIQAETPADPITQLDVALAAGDVGKIYSLLDSAWFGVPESTGCWNIRGFAEAVDLMDDPPDDYEPSPEDLE